MNAPSDPDPLEVAAAYPNPPGQATDAESPDLVDDVPSAGVPAAMNAEVATGAAGVPAEVVLSAEQLTAGTEWTVTGGVRFRRRIASYTRTVEVVVRREEFEVEVRDAADRHGAWVGTNYQGPAVPAPPTAAGPGMLVLREEVPEVVLAVRAYEQVTVHIDRVTEQVELHDVRRREQAMVTGDTGITRPPVTVDDR